MFYTGEGVLLHNNADPLRQQVIGFEYGAKIPSTKCFFLLGGGGTNVAVGAARLGLRTAAMVSVGADRDGDALLQDLKAEKVLTEGAERLPAYRTGFSFIAIAETTGEHVAFLFRGANDHLVLHRRNLEHRRPRWVYVSSLGAPAWPRASQVLRDTLGRRQLKFAWNPGEPQLALGYPKLRPLLRRTDVLILNKDEATELVLSSGVRMSPALERLSVLLRALKRCGPKMVVITDGQRGASVYNGHQMFHKAAIRSKVVDTTGAGDAFGAGFLTGLRRFNDLSPALHLALLNSASVCASIGSQKGLLYWSQVQKKFSKTA